MPDLTFNQAIVSLVATILTPGFLTMCWNVAAFAISAKKDIKDLTESVKRVEKNLESGMSDLQHRVGELEVKEKIRHAVETAPLIQEV